MTPPTPLRTKSATIERLGDAVALITAAQQMRHGQLSTQLFAEHIHDVSQQYASVEDALTHLALACAQVLHEAGATSPDTALARTGLAIAVLQTPPAQAG